jgi:OmpA-OmpF porin, OOP family
MRARRHHAASWLAALASWATALSAVLYAPAAMGTDCSGFLSPCVNDDTLWPHAGPARFVAVGSTETVASGQVAFGLVTSYLNRPVVLTTHLGATATDQDAVNDQVNGTFLWSYGVSDRLELDLAVPLTFGQGGTGLAPITGGYGLKDTAARDMRFGFAYALVPHQRADETLTPDGVLARRDAWGLVARLEVSAPTGDADQFAGDRSGLFVPSVAADWRYGRFFAGAEVGARVRPTTEVLGARIGTQLVTSMGVGYDFLKRQDLLTATLEAWALPTFAEQHEITNPDGVYVSTPDGRYIAPAEWQLSVRTAPLPGGDLSLQAGGGGGIPLTGDVAITTPRFRFTLGIRWAPLAYDSDHDGVPDTRDRCPSEPAQTPDGCPAAVASPGPVVDLHLSTARDVCTGDPALVDGFDDEDGCPVAN